MSEKLSVDGIKVGDIVGYVLHEGRSEGEVRPAIVVRIWNDTIGLVQLQVFTDSENDGLSSVYWATSIHYDATADIGTWHFLE